jgi:hypothetical protein
MAHKKKKKDELDKYRNRGILYEGSKAAVLGQSKAIKHVKKATKDIANYYSNVFGDIVGLSKKQKEKLKIKKDGGYVKKYAYGGRVAKYKD